MEDTVALSHYTAITSNYSFTLFKELTSSTDGNVFASTYSIQLLLLLLAFGSKSKTLDQLNNVLHFNSTKSENYEKVNSIITKIEVPDYLTIANGIFSDKAFSLNSNYINNAQKYFKSEARSVDFATNPKSSESEINKWVIKSTNGKISELFQPGVITADTKLVLASAVHFKNLWKSKFTKTKKASFCLTPTNHIDIQMMHQTDTFNYFKNDHLKFSAVEIPYQTGGFEMLIILPDKMDGVHDLEKAFMNKYKNYVNLLKNMTIHKVKLDIPKFKFDSTLNLKDTLEKLGCTDMFSPRADFSDMSTSNSGKLRVSSLIHKSFVDVSENGTEAAGITGSSIVTYKLPFIPSDIKVVEFYACHPFLFIIKKDKDIIFMGRLSNPNK